MSAAEFRKLAKFIAENDLSEDYANHMIFELWEFGKHVDAKTLDKWIGEIYRTRNLKNPCCGLNILQINIKYIAYNDCDIVDMSPCYRALERLQPRLKAILF